MPRFVVGSTVQRREVLHGQVWMTMPVHVVADDEDVAEQVARGRLTPGEADAVWREAERVASALDNGNCWWIPRWRNWKPAHRE